MNHESTFPQDVGPLHLSECAAEYAACLLDPCSAPPSCLPRADGQPSLKTKVWARGEFTTASVLANGGYIVFIPGLGIIGDIAGGTVWTSSAAVAVPGFPGGSGAAGNVTANTTTPYASANFGTTGALLKKRLVSCCIRIKERQTMMNQGGIAYGLVHPSHMSLVSLVANNLMAFEQTFRYQLSNEWIELKWTGPISDDECDYDALTGIVAATINCPCMGILVMPATASSVFDYEVYANYELVGGQIAGVGTGTPAVSAVGKTPGAIDAVGSTLVASALQTARQMAGVEVHDGKPAFKTMFKRLLVSGARKMLTYLSPVAEGALIASGVGAPFASAAGAAASIVANKGRAKLKKKIQHLDAKMAAQAAQAKAAKKGGSRQR